MSDIAVSIRGLSKSYIIKHNAERHTTLAEAMASKLRNPVQSQEKETFWALKDIDLDVKRGDVVGVIGRNGAGKSTLLKILSQITEPTKGEIKLYGRVASLLEVGTGFHPELTGRENIYLNGAILGMRKSEINRRFDEIVDFAEVEKFLDTPVKRYSSGMYVRLAFAVAAHLNPEILIVDEVLSVGDAAFQKKCLGKMGDVASHEGRTVIFVSHNMAAVRGLCQTCVLLDEGHIARNAETGIVIEDYTNVYSDKVSSLVRSWEPNDPLAPGNHLIRLTRVEIPDRTENSSEFSVAEPIAIRVEIESRAERYFVLLDVCIYHIDGTPVFESLSSNDMESATIKRGVYRWTCVIPGNLLNQGTYSVRILVTDHDTQKIVDLSDALIINVVEEERSIPWYGRFIGNVHPKLSWTVSQIR